MSSDGLMSLAPIGSGHVMVPNALSTMSLHPSFFLSGVDPMDLSMMPSTSTSDNHTSVFMPKEEPASSDSQPSTPQVIDRKVPACMICGADSTGIHFGVDACAACSAFFRRTVVLNKEYECNKNGTCIVSKDVNGGQKCRSCRFAKCLSEGMSRSAVQHRRDAIGKYAAGVKREISPCEQKKSISISPSPGRTRSEGGSILDELMERHECLMKKRKVFYTNRGCEHLFESKELEIVELTDYEECMYQIWRIEPRLAAEFVSDNRFLNIVDSEEKAKLFRNFVILRQAVEEPYLTWKFGGLENKWWIMPNRIYLNIVDAEKYWRTGVMSKLKLSYEEAKKLFLSSFESAMSTVSLQMKEINISETEMVALCGLTLIDPTVATLKPESKEILWNIRDQLLRDIFAYYEEDSKDPEVRLANLLMILGAVKTHALKTSENMHLINTFQLIAKDRMFEDICKGNIYQYHEQIP